MNENDELRWIGWDLASGQDFSAFHGRIEGMTFVCKIPRGLGNVTALDVRNGRVVATTESGVEMIVPVVD